MALKANVKHLDDNRRDINYPDDRAGYAEPRELFGWRDNPIGRLALTALFFFVESKVSMIQIILGRDYKSYGVTKETTTAFLKRAVPELFVEYERLEGKPMPLDLPIKRVYPWYLEPRKPGVKGKNKTMGPEHPLNWATKEEINAGLQRAIEKL